MDLLSSVSFSPDIIVGAPLIPLTPFSLRYFTQLSFIFCPFLPWELKHLYSIDHAFFFYFFPFSISIMCSFYVLNPWSILPCYILYAVKFHVFPVPHGTYNHVQFPSCSGSNFLLLLLFHHLRFWNPFFIFHPFFSLMYSK